jgi:hypothetical protein
MHNRWSKAVSRHHRQIEDIQDDLDPSMMNGGSKHDHRSAANRRERGGQETRGPPVKTRALRDDDRGYRLALPTWIAKNVELRHELPDHEFATRNTLLPMEGIDAVKNTDRCHDIG